MPVLSESHVEIDGTNYTFSKVAYTSSAASTFLIDQSAVSVAVAKPTSNAPSVSIGSSDSATFLKTVTLAAGGASGEVTVITTHSGTIASNK